VQIAVLQALLARKGEAGEIREGEVAASRSNTRLDVNMAEILTFSKEINKVLGFLTVCKLCIRIRMKNASVEKQI